MRHITKKPQALQDLKDIWLYIADDNPRSADELLLRIEKKCQALTQFPYMGQERPELEQDIHSLVVGRYVIFYRVTDTAIELVRVLHSARDIPAQFRPGS